MTRWFSLVHPPSGIEVARIERADSWLARGIGVLGRQGLPEGAGMWLPQCGSIHTCGVQFSLDVCFFDQNFIALRLVRDVPPWTLVVRHAKARHTVELAGGAIARSGVEWRDGDRWEIREIPGD